ncbi:MAG: acyltransferase [Paracoccus sp. (in: a-proteobacteria)]|uniref:acyltransferase family protein n=1 Tax=Paracoccus sp. TaxID=267 RepID=UPI0026E0454D|nr:acyltransferase [Paracoccus sp. (in: a-proteobacteria)]MDO5630667.1 acyltransferase [Paracoccus sp. (in: a-proteobacteria)]
MLPQSRPDPGRAVFPIETARALAVLLLVSYHVIGASPENGLELDYPSGYRIFAGLFADLRMPLFAFIAGMVFAIRPPQRGQVAGFLTGKLRRLAVPGAIAILAFAILADLSHTSFSLNGAYWWPFVTGYAHFWFLQAILLIFWFYAPVDAFLGGRGTAVLTVLAFALWLSGFHLSENPLSVNGAILLLPYFLLGAAVFRHRAAIMRHRKVLAAVACVTFAAGVAMNLSILDQTGRLSENARDLQSMLVGTGGCLAAMLALPHIRLLEKIGPASFTIYLYHVFATSGMRRFLEGMEITSLPVNLLAGVAAGILLPVALHTICRQNPVTRQLVLGEKTAPRQPLILAGGKT